MTHETVSIAESSAALRLRKAHGALCMATLVALIVSAGIKGLTVATLFGRPVEITVPEAANAYVARRIQQGGPLYADWRRGPHVLATYGPAFYLPVAHVGRWIRADVHGLYMIGRWMSLLATIGTGVVIVWILRSRRAVPRAMALMMALIFLTADEVFCRHDISYRPDSVVCFLTLLAAGLLIRSDRPLFLYGTLGVFLLTFLYKQSSIGGPLAVAVWLWLTGRRRRSLEYAAITCLAFAGVVALLNASNSGMFFLNTIEALRGRATFRNIPTLFFWFIKAAIVPVAGSFCAITWEWSRWRWSIATILLVLSLVLSAAGTYRDGSNAYYYMLPLALSCVVCGRQIGEWLECRAGSMAGWPAMTLMMVLAATVYVPQALRCPADGPGLLLSFWHRAESSKAQAESFSRLADYLNALPGPVLSQFDDVGLYCPRSIMIDTFTFSSMADAGVFDDRPLIEDLRQARISAVVLNPRLDLLYQSTDLFSRRWRQAMEGRYQRIEVPGLEWAEIYRPVGLPASTAPGRSTAPG
jgi:hypothetical protein